MRKGCLGVVVVMWVSFCLILPAFGQTPAPKDERKHTTAGKYATSVEAYEMWKAAQDKVKVLDVRTPEEYVYVGHPPMAFNVPSKVWSGKFNAEKKDYDLDDNADFEAQVKKLFPPDTTLVVLCRSGHRSAAAVNRLTRAGFTNVYNIVDGFEGDKISDEDSYNKGKREKNGWKNSTAPWTYDLDAKLVYTPAK